VLCVRQLAPVPHAHGSASMAVVGGRIHLIIRATLPARLNEEFIHPSRNVSVGTDPVDDPATNNWSPRDALPPLARGR